MNESCVPDDDDDDFEDDHDHDDDDDDDGDDHDDDDDDYDDDETAGFTASFDRRIVCSLTIKPLNSKYSSIWFLVIYMHADKDIKMPCIILWL